MKTKSKERINVAKLQQRFIALNTPQVKMPNYPVPREFDLFGETSVLISEVNLWMETVTIYNRHSPRFDWYVQNWDVIGKIKRTKLAFGTLEAYFKHNARMTRHYA